MNFPNLEDDPRLSTVCGLVCQGVEWEEGGRSEHKPSKATGGLGEKLKKIFKAFLP